MILTRYRIKVHVQIVYNFCQFVYINKQILKNNTFFRKKFIIGETFKCILMMIGT